MKFYLGTHRPWWLGEVEFSLMVSNRVLYDRKTFPRAKAPWILDSGGFSELSMYGEWRTTPRQYIALARRYRDEVGNMEWAAIQDWMCEPFVTAKTGLSVREHQRRTVLSYLTLTHLAPDIPWTPVIQGYLPGQYHSHVALYNKYGVDLTKQPIVGVGSVCRRQHTDQAGLVFTSLARRGIRVHGFGVKIQGIRKYASSLASADSMAWSFDARYGQPLAGHTHKHCGNCIEAAVKWRQKVVDLID